MTIEKHDLHSEFPEFADEIQHLKMTDAHFSRLFKEYHNVDKAVHKIENGVKNTKDEYLEYQKLQRLHLKDQLFLMIKKSQFIA
jgi:uncharacterized protein YdcH (DUF465 family)